jgi:hypothetical protein
VPVHATHATVAEASRSRRGGGRVRKPSAASRRAQFGGRRSVPLRPITAGARRSRQAHRHVRPRTRYAFVKSAVGIGIRVCITRVSGGLFGSYNRDGDRMDAVASLDWLNPAWASVARHRISCAPGAVTIQFIAKRCHVGALPRSTSPVSHHDAPESVLTSTRVMGDALHAHPVISRRPCATLSPSAGWTITACTSSSRAGCLASRPSTSMERL